MRKPYVFIFSFLILLTILFLAVLKPADKADYGGLALYGAQMKRAESVGRALYAKPEDTTRLQVGWATVSILPDFPTPIAIDAQRGGRHYQGVRDTLFVKAIVFKSGNRKCAFLTADLLIIPPTLTRALDTIVRADGYSLQNLFLSATHTHSSIGGWYPSLVGEIFAGKFDSRVPLHLARSCAQAIRLAEADCKEAEIGFGSLPASGLVENRLVHEKGEVDSVVRVLKIVKADGASAALVTFSAHATVFHHDMMQLSADWPGMFRQKLQQRISADFVAYAAGAVGSHGPYPCCGKNREEQISFLAEGLSAVVASQWDSMRTRPVSEVRMAQVPVDLRPPNLRVNSYFSLRPWLFYRLFGEEQVYISFLKVGEVKMIGMPCDFSGELLAQIQREHAAAQDGLMLTGFNGGYMGYVTDDRWYELNAYETRTMSWYGPGNGSFFKEIIKRLIIED